MESKFNSLKQAHESFNWIGGKIASASRNQSKQNKIDTGLTKSIDIMNEFFLTAKLADSQDERKSPDQITEIGNLGLELVGDLAGWTQSFNLHQENRALGQVSLVIAEWIITRQGQIQVLELIVDGLSELANALQDKDSLKELVIFMEQIVHACSDSIKHDLDVTDMSRPWRVLHINRGIVATRTHDPEIMRKVFAKLLATLPFDAPNFFKEGMSEMVRLNYPDHVREVIQVFFDQCAPPRLH